MASQQSNTVSWQSGFLGLVPLALNAMTQPSTLDIKLPESSILFSARSSPFICVADAVEVLIELCIHLYQGRKLREAAKLVNWSRARRRLGSDITSLEESAAEKHPKSFFILFIAILLQAIKILGLGGLFWTKVWAGCYFCSYVVLAAVQFLAPEGWRDDPLPTRATSDSPSTEEDIMTAVHQLVVERLAVGAHIWCTCNALSRVVHPHIPSTHEDINNGSLVSLITAFLFGYIGSISNGVVLFAILDFLCLLLKHVLLVKHSLHRMRSALQSLNIFLTGNVTALMSVPGIATGFGALFAFAVNKYINSNIFLAGTRYAEIKIFLDSHGRTSLIICSGVFVLFYHLIDRISKKVYLLRWLRPQPDLPQYVVLFPFLNFFKAFMYYRFVYDPRETVKPAWTENLG